MIFGSDSRPVNQQAFVRQPGGASLALHRKQNAAAAHQANIDNVVTPGWIGELEVHGNRYINAMGRLREQLRRLGAKDEEDT